MIHRLSEHPDQKAAVQKLIREHFPAGSPLSPPAPIEKEFPLLLSKQNQRGVFYLSMDGLPSSPPIATAAYKIFHFPTLHLKVAAIGLVVTHPNHRRQGHSDKILQYIEREAAAEGAALAILWSDLDDFYRKRGYWPSGSEYQWSMEGIATASTPSHEISSLSTYTEIEKLHIATQWGPTRSSSDGQALLDIPETFAYALKKNGHLNAYAVVGKGRDLRNVVHEFGGPPEDVVTLVKCLLARHPLHRLLSPVDENYCRVFDRELGRTAEKVAMAYMKVLSLDRYVGILKPWLEKTVDLSHDSRTFRLSVNQKLSFESDDPAHLLQIFAGPWLPSEVEGLPPMLGEALKDWRFPNFYFWGFDSV